jgi:hypothetical protein
MSTCKIADEEVEEMKEGDEGEDPAAKSRLARKVDSFGMAAILPQGEGEANIKSCRNAAVRASKAENILVVWHDQSLPKIMSALGGPEIAPIIHTEYDRFLILKFPGENAHAAASLITLRYCNETK